MMEIPMIKFIRMIGYFVLILIFVTDSYAQTVNLCSNQVGTRCDCSYSSGKLRVNCQQKSLAFIPAGIQRDTSIADFSHNSITSVEVDDLNGLDDLTTLFLQNNSISTIAPGAFKKLYKLMTLNLQKNKLTEVKNNYFVYLPSLVSLDVSSNLITRFDRHTLIRLPKLGQLAITDNPLNCDCHMRVFKQSIDARMGNLLVLSGFCAGTNTKLTDMRDGQFGSCTGIDLFKSVTCMDCKNVRSTEDCIEQNQTTTCSVSQYTQPSCFEELVYVDSGLIINKGCQTYDQCLGMEINNDNLCYEPIARCRFCCVGHMCNRPALRGRIHNSSYMATGILRQEMPADLRNTGSAFYANFVIAVESQIDNILNNRPDSRGSFVSTIVAVREPKVTVDISIVLSTIHEVASDDRADYIKKQITSLVNMFSYPIHNVTVVLSDRTCLSETTNNVKGQFSWSSASPGEIASTHCPANANEKATRACVIGQQGIPMWAAPDTTACQNSQTVTESLETLSNTPITSSNVDSVQTDLLSLTKQSEQFTGADVTFSVDVIENVLDEGSIFTNTQTSQQMVESMSNILNSPDTAISATSNTKSASERLVDSVERMANSLVPSSASFSAVRDNLALLVREADPANFDGITMNALVKPGEKLDYNKIEVKDGEDIASLNSGVVVPASFFNKGVANPSRFAFAVYGNNKLFKNIDNSGLQTSNKTNEVSGPVIATTLQKTNVTNLQQPVIFRFQHINKNYERPQCVFIKTVGTQKMQWSDEGCTVKTHEPGSHTDCECNHLTSFALLMDVYQTGGTLSKANILALTYISYVGCGVSLLGLLLTLITYFMFRKLRSNNPSKILINLCVALTITNIIFLVGMQEYTLENHIGCKIVAVSLHYVLLSALCWMLVEAFYMYLALIRVFNTYFSHFLLKCCLFGWGIPLVIVGVTLGINPTNNYGEQSGGICWLSPIPFYASFLAPVGVILILNCISFVLVFRVLLKGSSKKIANKSDSKNHANSISQRLKGAVALIMLLGLTWAFAIFAIGDGGIIFQYLFTIFNSLQGLFIFIFYCLLKTDAQQAWKRKLTGGKPQYAPPTTSSKDRNSDIRSRDTASHTYTSEVSESKKEFTDISKEIDAAYPEARAKAKANSKRYPSYCESNT